MADNDDWNNGVIKEFRENEGRVGGVFDGMPMILVHHTGAKTGTKRVTPLVYLGEDERIYIFASMGGAPQHPAWFHNLVANPQAKAEIGTEVVEVEAVVIEGTERDEIYARQAALLPNFAEYQEKTTRVIPVVELKRV